MIGVPVYIHGGTIIATGGGVVNFYGGAGIGGSFGCSNGTITITGGNITATGARSAAGIGSGPFNDCEADITITGGNITATGGSTQSGHGGAGIGAGLNTSGLAFTWHGDLEATVTIGGNAIVSASGGGINNGTGRGGAGIGGGFGGNAGNGKVIIKDNAEVIAVGGDEAAGIGGGAEVGDYGGEGAEVSITGNARVAALSGGYKTCAIGNGGGDSYKGPLTLGDNMKVQAGNNGSEYERTFTTAERVSACQYRYAACVEPCDRVTT